MVSNDNRRETCETLKKLFVAQRDALVAMGIDAAVTNLDAAIGSIEVACDS